MNALIQSWWPWCWETSQIIKMNTEVPRPGGSCRLPPNAQPLPLLLLLHLWSSFSTSSVRCPPSFLRAFAHATHSACNTLSSASSHLPWPKQLLFPLLGNSTKALTNHPIPHLVRSYRTLHFFLHTRITILINLFKQYIFSLNGMSKEKRKPHLLAHHSTPRGEPTPCSSINIYWANK